MKIYLDNVNLGSTSGPNHFASKLTKYMKRTGAIFESDKYDVQLSFIQSTQNRAPIFQRLDGIYFNSAQEFEKLNAPIKNTYEKAKGVIFQSEFNKELTFKYFGTHDNYKVIHNGADLELIERVRPLKNLVLDRFDAVWCCASSWRPHKRLRDNITYFLQNSNKDDCMVVAGQAPREDAIKHERVFYVGNLDIETLYGLYKRSKYFVHLAYLDHCPNVVVDASACGCHIICSSAGGTKEIAGNATLIVEDEWDLKPTRLYEPPKLDFSRREENTAMANIDMSYVASQYYKFLGE